MWLPLVDSIQHLLFPHNCNGCGSDLVGKDELLCLQCFERLSKTGFEHIRDNAVEKMLWGRVNIDAAMSCYYFTGNTIIQSLIHQFKYKGNQAMGIYLGKQMGYALRNSDRFSQIELIIPLPLFVDKEKKRGYNQSALLTNGIASVLDIPVLPHAVRRLRHTESQTHKSRTERWQNVEGIFKVDQPDELKAKNILLVDDVITTGATIEACAASMINEAPGSRVSVATLAYALNQ